MTTPKTWAVGEIVTAAMLNTEVRDRVKVKEFFIPATACSNNGAYIAPQPIGSTVPGALLNHANDIGFAAFHCPADFGSLVEAVLVVIPQATQASANWDIGSNYGAVGQAYNTHSESDAATTYNVTQNQTFEVSIAGILTSLAAGDYVGVNLLQGTAGHDVGVMGIRFKYNVT